METKQYLDLLRRWAWLLILGVLLGGLGSYFYSANQSPVYLSSTKILVNRAPQGQNTDLAYLTSQQLAQTFIQLLKTKPVLESASARLGYPIRDSQVKAEQLRDTQIIILTVEDNDAWRSAAIANMLVQVLIEQNDSLQSGRYLDMEQSLQAQVQQVSAQISQLQDQINRLTTENVQEQVVEVEAKIAQLQSEIALLERDINRSTYNGRFPSLAPPELVARQAQLKSTLELYQQIYANLLVLGQPTSAGMSDRLGGLQKTLELYQQIYLQLLASLEQVRLARLQNTPSIVQIDDAVVPGSPVRPVPLQTAMLGAAVGLMLAFGIAFAVEYLDDTLRSPSDVERILGLPVLGYIADIGKPGKPGILHVSVFPRSLIAEAFRNLRSGIELSEGERAPRTIFVTSSRPGEGKTTIASNLAAVFAQSGRRVLLVDADLRCPSVHRMVGLPNRVGLSTLFRDSLKPEAVLKEPGGNSYGLQVITSGARPANPSELLGSEKMLHILAELHQRADIIVFDGPPMMVADAQVLATLVDAVLLILQPGKSPADEAKSTLTQLQRSGANVIGVVFNRVPKHSGHYYGGYRYYAAPAYKSYRQKGPVEYIPVAPPSRPASLEPATRSNGHHSEELTY